MRPKLQRSITPLIPCTKPQTKRFQGIPVAGGRRSPNAGFRAAQTSPVAPQVMALEGSFAWQGRPTCNQAGARVVGANDKRVFSNHWRVDQVINN